MITPRLDPSIAAGECRLEWHNGCGGADDRIVQRLLCKLLLLSARSPRDPVDAATGRGLLTESGISTVLQPAPFTPLSNNHYSSSFHLFQTYSLGPSIISWWAWRRSTHGIWHHHGASLAQHSTLWYWCHGRGDGGHGRDGNHSDIVVGIGAFARAPSRLRAPVSPMHLNVCIEPACRLVLGSRTRKQWRSWKRTRGSMECCTYLCDRDAAV